MERHLAITYIITFQMLNIKCDFKSCVAIVVSKLSVFLFGLGCKTFNHCLRYNIMKEVSGDKIIFYLHYKTLMFMYNPCIIDE